MKENKYFLVLKDLKKTYDDGYVACQNINMSIDKGKFVTILGPSGCGKTTLLKMIAGFEKPTNGKIIVNGVDIKDLPIHKRNTATVFQDYALFPNMTVYQNIAYGVKLLRKRFNRVPKKYTSMLEKTRNDALAKATHKIQNLKDDQLRIDIEINRWKRFYNKNEYLKKIIDMRYSAFTNEIFKLEKKLFVAKGPKYPGFKISLKNKWRLYKNRFLKFFGINHLTKFDNKGLHKLEIKILDLIRYFDYKSKIDAKIDHLYAKYRDKDEWISYWENYPNLKVEEFEKYYTTRPYTKQEMQKEVEDVISLVGLNGNENKYPFELSGGMRQRVALARAIVVKPDILLLDEPLSALDAKVRKKMQEELKQIHNELKINFILVTHDQEEALSLSDTIIVMSKGKIEQIGSPKNIYEHPSNMWVANFIGQANFVHAVYLGKNCFKIENKKYSCSLINYNFSKLAPKTEFIIVLRPEDIQVCKQNKGFKNVKIVSSTYKGTFYDTTCETKLKSILHFQTTDYYKNNENVGIKWNFKYCSILLNNKKNNHEINS